MEVTHLSSVCTPAPNRLTGLFFNTEKSANTATVVTTRLTIAALTFQNSGLVTLALQM